MKQSAGLILFRRASSGLEVLIAHPGGPFFAKKDAGAWTIPKGLIDAGEAPIDTARREFEEETGLAPPEGEWLELGEITQKGGKRVLAWAVEGDCDPSTLESNRFELEWPPRSGRRQSFPELDRFRWAGIDDARVALNQAQAELLDRLLAKV